MLCFSSPIFRVAHTKLSTPPPLRLAIPRIRPPRRPPPEPRRRLHLRLALDPRTLAPTPAAAPGPTRRTHARRLLLHPVLAGAADGAGDRGGRPASLRGASRRGGGGSDGGAGLALEERLFRFCCCGCHCGWRGRGLIENGHAEHFLQLADLGVIAGVAHAVAPAHFAAGLDQELPAHLPHVARFEDIALADPLEALHDALPGPDDQAVLDVLGVFAAEGERLGHAEEGVETAGGVGVDGVGGRGELRVGGDEGGGAAADDGD